MNSPGKSWCLIGLGIVAALASRPARAGRPAAAGGRGGTGGARRRCRGDPSRHRHRASLRDRRTDEDAGRSARAGADRRARSGSDRDVAPHERRRAGRPFDPLAARACRAVARHRLAGRQPGARSGESDPGPGGRRSPDPSPTVAPSPPSGVDRASTPPAVPPATEPPGFETPAVTVASSARSQPEQQARWTVSAAAGPAISTYGLGHALRQSIFGSWTLGNSLYDVFHQNTTVWRVDLRHHADASRTFTGLTLEGSGGNYYQPDVIGAMALVGSGLRLGRWVLEGSLGAGIDLGRRARPRRRVDSHRERRSHHDLQPNVPHLVPVSMLPAASPWPIRSLVPWTPS